MQSTRVSCQPLAEDFLEPREADRGAGTMEADGNKWLTQDVRDELWRAVCNVGGGTASVEWSKFGNIRFDDGKCQIVVDIGHDHSGHAAVRAVKTTLRISRLRAEMAEATLPIVLRAAVHDAVLSAVGDVGGVASVAVHISDDTRSVLSVETTFGAIIHADIIIDGGVRLVQDWRVHGNVCEDLLNAITCEAEDAIKSVS